MWGLIAAGLFKDDGVLYTGNANMLIWNSIGGAAIIVWHAVFGAITFFLLSKMGSFRILRCKSGTNWSGQIVS